MSNARNISKLLPNTSGQLPTSNIQDNAINLAKIADAAVGRTKIGFTGSALQTVSAYNNTQFSMSANVTTALSLQVTITPTSNNSKFLILAYGHADDNSSTSWGIGLGVTCIVGGTERWYSHQGSHHNYVSGGNDHYFHAMMMEIDYGTGHQGGDMPVVAGQARTYKMYGASHNDGCRWNANNISANADTMSRSMGSTNTYGSRIIVVELA